MIRTFLLTLLSVFPFYIIAQTVPTFGTPYIQSYSKTQYKAGNQNWGIAQGLDGVIYVANSNGLLVYDGSYWNIYPLDNKNNVRSVAIAPNGDIFVGGKEEFGYYRKVKGKLIYHKLSHLVDEDKLNNDEIWKILFLDDSVLFQSFSKLYQYKNDKITIHDGDGEPLLFAHQRKDNVWIEKIPSGLHTWSDKGFSKLDTKLSNIMTILPFKNDQYLIGTAKDGLYILNGKGEVKKWPLNGNGEWLLSDAQLNNGIQLNDNTYAFGTIKNGIFIIDNEGNIIQHLHKRNGLQNNTVLSMTIDEQKNIWAGLDNGIDRIEINSPFHYYKDIYGELGTVYAIKIFNNNIYLGTNQGLFYSPWPNSKGFSDLSFKFIPGTQGQVWSLDVFNNQLICGHNEGTFLVNDNKVQKISSYTGGWVNKQISPNQFLQGNYTGLALFQDNNTWQLAHKFGQPKIAVIDLIKKDNRQYWLVFNNSLQLAELSLDNQNITPIKTFSFNKDFPKIQRITPVLVENNIVFVSDKGVFVYDNVLSKFKPYTELNNILGSYANANRIKDIGNGKYIFANEGHFAEVYFIKGQIKIDSTSFDKLENIVMKNHEIVEPFGSKILFGLDNGIAIYDKAFLNAPKIANPLVKGFQYISSNIDSIHSLSMEIPIPNSQNSIRILYSSPWYSNTPLKYQYMLEGYKDEWSIPSETPYIDFTNLDFGTYTFHVRAISSNGEQSEVTSIPFRILPPWYLMWQAVVVYIIAAGAIIVVGRKLVLRKIAHDKFIIRREYLKKQDDLLRKETEENEKKLMALKNEQLSQELDLKSRELANAATSIVYKNELLNNLNDELLNVKDKEGKKLSTDQLHKVNKLIDTARNDERDWDLFERSFNESHGNFFKKLKLNYPTLSPNDLKLCAYLRLNMSSKDIASVINISIRGVEIRRYRLRKKFDLPTDKNLNEFLIEL